MPDLYWSQLTVDHVLNFGVLVLMVLMVLGLAVWFVCSIAENTVKMGRQIGHSNYEALLRENGITGKEPGCGFSPPTNRALPLWDPGCRQVHALFSRLRFRPVLPHALEAVLRPEPKPITRLRMPTNR